MSDVVALKTAAKAPARRGRPPKAAAAERPAETSEMILDAAEDLFSKHGFHGVTIREVAREAGVDTALLHYYFGTKRGLFDAVFLRRAEVMNGDRMKAMNAYAARAEAAGEALTPEGVIEAFLAPVFELSAKGGPGWKHYCALVSQTNANPSWGGETMTRYFDPVVYRLIELVRRALPTAEPADLFWAYHNLSGALTLSMGETGRLDRLSGGLCKSGDLDSVLSYMVRFAGAGFRAVCVKP
ncbi:TetR/AcrR family transcriptional regulator [Caulobacter sp. 17J65-9]|uniref:TetR/AcrR family transcriptional regulator n=1 Tax=Caulobacter sp. 17J65-9 TaxID=2709382 RepID=UPI0013C84FD2|nr:TetR/AcrR family transcriptional regulator [Caulobacter sp. 17J65-9]NEX93578.1 helix-turn-helix transcriptional regulator [Caulobacter sp. 17J65-9]